MTPIASVTGDVHGGVRTAHQPVVFAGRRGPIGRESREAVNSSPATSSSSRSRLRHRSAQRSSKAKALSIEAPDRPGASRHSTGKGEQTDGATMPLVTGAAGDSSVPAALRGGTLTPFSTATGS